MATKKTVFTTAWSAADLYYARLSELLTAIGDSNQVKGVYDKLDVIQEGRYVRDEVMNVFNHYFGGDITVVQDKYDEYVGRIDRCRSNVKQALEVLKISCTDDELDQFIMLAYGTRTETTFRGKAQGYINTQRRHLGEQVRSKNPKSVEVLTPADMVAKYQKGLRHR